MNWATVYTLSVSLARWSWRRCKERPLRYYCSCWRRCYTRCKRWGRGEGEGRGKACTWESSGLYPVNLHSGSPWAVSLKRGLAFVLDIFLSFLPSCLSLFFFYFIFLLFVPPLRSSEVWLFHARCFYSTHESTHKSHPILPLQWTTVLLIKCTFAFLFSRVLDSLFPCKRGNNKS